ncbi:DUF459 domain-containing protein [Sphingomonas sp. MMS24-J13]|uniref:SGNH/GDSL hydrolase family protein n=1 Tax=Sphingomonas sp. MMS24-J13 TaxID=3238686 RepID=UPI00384DCA0E
MNRFTFLLDRTAVLFLGIAAGAAIGFAFAHGGSRREAMVVVPQAAPVTSAPASIAPPPPTAPTDAAKPPEKGVVVEPVTTVPAADGHVEQLLDTLRGGDHVVRVGVFGDSFGDGVWSALYRMLPAKDGYRVIKYSQASTGFTRYRSLNLETHDNAQIGDDKLAVAVIAFGANDVQGVCEGSHCGALMSSSWQAIIGQRIESYVAMLRRHGATVYWMGLPAMRDPAFDSDTSAMEAFYASTMQRLGVPYIDIRPFTVDSDGHYQAYYADADGTPKLLRAGDGIHMSMNGYLRISKGLADRIRSTVAAARAAAPAQASDSAEENQQ